MQFESFQTEIFSCTFNFSLRALGSSNTTEKV